jgi:hypothetical protein
MATRRQKPTVEGRSKLSCGSSRSESLSMLIRKAGGTHRTSKIGDFIGYVRDTSARWQEGDKRDRADDEELTLNIARIVGQVWFRGHRDCDLSLRPGLYRDENIKALRKPGFPENESNRNRLFNELMDLEHELRIDFISFAHLLNVGQAKSQLDWYFLMQHHGVPTRLLDWTTNALASLFFALEAYQRKKDQPSHQIKRDKSSRKNCVAVWVIDAYWLANRMSEEWSSPLLPWSEDASQFPPALEQLLEKNTASKRLVPEDAMPIEPPAMHPRVAAQEGRFIIFGSKTDLLEHKIQLERLDSGEFEESRVKLIQFDVGDDVESLFEELAQLGVSRRTLFPDLDGLATFIRWKHFHKVGGYNLESSGG